MVVYLDILFFLNFGINYLLLRCVGRLGGKACFVPRLLLSAALGGVLSAVLFFAPAQGLWGLFIKALCCLLLCLTAFSIRSPGEALRLSLLLLSVTMAMGGGVMALTALSGSHRIWVRGGVPYVHLPIQSLLFSFGAAYVLLSLAFSARRGERRAAPARVKIRVGDRWAEVHALRDTGNLLRDPMSQKRVMVVEKSCLVPLLSWEERQALENLRGDNGPEIFERLRSRRFLLLPYQAVGQPGALLLAMKPDKMLVDGREEKEVLIGIAPGRISTPEGCQAILG